MTWILKYKIRSFLSYSLWIVPMSGAVAGILFHRLVWTFNLKTSWELLHFTSEGARALVGAFSSSMLGFIVFLVTMIFVAVQLAVGQLTPRIIALVFRLRTIRIPLAIFIFSYVFCLSALGRIGDPVPQLVVMLTVIFTLVSIGVFLYLIEALGRWLRPIKVYASVAEEGIRVIESVYPVPFTEPKGNEAPRERDEGAAPARMVHHEGKSGMLLAFDVRGLTAVARRAGCVIRIVHQVGDFIAAGDPLFYISEGGESLGEAELRQRVALGPERTLEQDPMFAFRIIVDISIKALSPSINDPTTAVAGIDQIDLLLRKVGTRDLGDGMIRDRDGKLRLMFPTPDWDDFVRLGVSEIRLYGAGSIQIARRLRAMMKHLLKTLPPQRAFSLHEQLTILDRSVKRGFVDPEDRAAAGLSDYQGVGGSRTDSADET